MHLFNATASPMMVRDLDALTVRRFDLLVVGGGVHGLMAAWDAALRGLHVALIERRDFGGGASFHHHRTLHGGLRYLQSADLARLRESVRERRAWARIAPQFIAPQAFAVAAGGRGKPPGLLRVGFALDGLLAWDRNRDVAPALQLPAATVLDGSGRSNIATGDLLPAAPIGLWYDYRTEHAERLTFAIAQAASEAGAVLANYVDAVEPIREGRKIAGIVARDGIDGAQLAIAAQVTINATGAAAGRLMSAFGVRTSPLLVKAMNLVTRRPAPPVACGAPSRSGRLLFALPWQRRLAIGTWHAPRPCGADEQLVSSDELTSFLAEINEAFPDLGLTETDVTLVQRGVVPARMHRGRLELADRPVVREHRADGIDGAITLMGVKYTTARAVAERAVTLAMAQLGRHAPPKTAVTPLPGAEPGGSESPVQRLDAESWHHLERLYGSSAGEVAAFARSRPELADRITPGVPIVGAQIVEAVRNEMALTLEDVVLRRTGLGSAGYPGDAAILRVETILRDELGWTSARAADELQMLKEFYLPIRL
jgi:glycerol-3-phosphate dehydrogenase